MPLVRTMKTCLCMRVCMCIGMWRTSLRLLLGSAVALQPESNVGEPETTRQVCHNTSGEGASRSVKIGGGNTPNQPNPVNSNHPRHPQVEESLLKRRTRTYTRKARPAYSLSLDDTPGSSSNCPMSAPPPYLRPILISHPCFGPMLFILPPSALSLPGCCIRKLFQRKTTKSIRRA